LSGGELFEKVADDQNRMTEAEARRYMAQVCHGLKHMHEMSYVHLVIFSQYEYSNCQLLGPETRKYHVHYKTQ
jgi:serine/threonine protein kinase